MRELKDIFAKFCSQHIDDDDDDDGDDGGGGGGGGGGADDDHDNHDDDDHNDDSWKHKCLEQNISVKILSLSFFSDFNPVK